jgi:hypothetical protein
VKKHNNSAMKSEPTSKRAKSRGPVQRDTKEVLAELVETLRKKLDPKVEAESTGEEDRRGRFRPNLDRLTVGVDLGDQWSHYCILGLEGETLAEGQLRTTHVGSGNSEPLIPEILSRSALEGKTCSKFR